MIHAVIDTNVIVSAHITKKLNAATSKVWESVLQGNLIPIYNEEILEEYKDVLHRKKFNIPDSLVQKTIDRIVANGLLEEHILCDEVFPDPMDVTFYEVALSEDDAYLVTQNTKHFPKAPIVITPEMLEILLQEEDC